MRHGQQPRPFPIPMRGNEFKQAKLTNAEVQFPIPMRGNERDERVAERDAIAGFRSP